jgi:hypothetical protein
MSPRRISSSLVASAILALVVATAQGADPDPLARPEFDQDITLNMPGADVVHVYDTLARLARVPFILAFDTDDPRLKVTFKAENMGIRAILASVAKTYELEYSPSDEGVVVSRKGQPPTEKRKTVGPWRASGPQYHFSFMIRDKSGNVLSTPAVTTQIKQALEVKQGIKANSVGGPLGDTFLTFKVVPQKETEAGLECTVTWEERYGATMTAVHGETTLFKTQLGYEVVLIDWSRKTGTP